MAFVKPILYGLCKTRRKKVLINLNKLDEYFNGMKSIYECNLLMARLTKKTPSWYEPMNDLYKRMQPLFEETERKIRQTREEIEDMQLIENNDQQK